MEIETRLRERLTANLAAQAGEPAARTARALLALDPSDENACRALMRESVRAGATARALEAYARLWNHLDEEYGIEPSAETRELVAEIKMQPEVPAVTRDRQPPDRCLDKVVRQRPQRQQQDR